MAASASTLVALSALSTTASSAATTYANVKQQQNIADAAKVNARSSQNEATAIAQQTSAREDMFRRRRRDFLARGRAAGAETGLVAAEGSLADLQEMSAIESELDALTIRYEGGLEQRSALFEAKQFKQEARTAKRGARTALLSGLANTGAKAAKGYAKYDYYKRNPDKELEY